MSNPAKERDSGEAHESFKPVYEFHLYYRLHLLWLLTVISIFLGQAWWLIPLPGDTPLPHYRTYPASVLKGLFEGLAAFLATRSLVVALIKVFTNGIYPDSVIKFRSTGGVEAIISGLRCRAGFRYLIIASILPVAFLIGNLLQAEFQSSTTVFYPLRTSSSNMDAAQCQHTTQKQYDVASTAFSKGLITNSLSDASSILDFFDKSALSNFGVSLLSADFTPVSNISVQASNQSVIVKRHHRPCNDDDFDDDSSSSTRNSITEMYGAVTTLATKDSSYSTDVPAPLSSEGQSTNSPTSITVFQQTTDANTAAFPTATPIQESSNSANSAQSGIQQGTNNTSTALTASQNGSNTFVILVDGYPITNLTEQMRYLQTLPSITTNNISLNRSIDLYILRYSSPQDREAIIIVSNPPEYYKAGFYISAKYTNYTCFSGSVLQCSKYDTTAADTNNNVVADALANAMRSNTGLYGTSGLIKDVIHGQYQNGTKLADALFTNPLCSDLNVYPIIGHVMYPYTRATWTILAIIWAILLIIIWAIGAYLIGYTIDIFCQLTQIGTLIQQIISNSTIFVDNEEGRPIKQEMYLNWEEVELFANDREIEDPNTGYTVTEEEL
ncbi:hypothetical protein G6F56_002579 [Rhizopus delemar]|uniref:Uncharacterized protein n=1 Tax=Rhizopus stolonifer TaxID=4846 RepID=A0A367KI45_RHIST|nr:hypothetical protein G6F56_002579 [Rhizopus delemar]RCI01829.1 hypothetical protein CU098_008998 [Rhizopus stolonifer]